MGRRLCVFLLVVVGSTAVGWQPAAAVPDVGYRQITFPVEGPTRYHSDYGAPREGGKRSHKGNDIVGTKLQRLLAANDATVSWLRADGKGNILALRDAAGWEYWYIHVNNDTPGTDDGLNPLQWVFGPGIRQGATVKAGQHVAFLGDSGNAEGTVPHLHFEIHRPDGTAVDPYPSLRLSQGLPVGNRCGYDRNPARAPQASSAAGYWTLARDGGVFSFGTAGFFGSTGGRRLNQPVVGMAPTPTGQGYWLVASDGGIFSFGDARFFGSTGALALRRPVVGMAPTPTGLGYWLVASDGGIFSFGDARFLGSAGGRPGFEATSMARTPTGRGYWLLGSGGDVLHFGDAGFHGAPSRSGLCRLPRMVRLAPTAGGKGYLVQGDDGGIWAFGDARHHGDLPDRGIRSAAPVLDLVVFSRNYSG